MALQLSGQSPTIPREYETSNKQQAKDIEARERARILEGRHGIRRQKDIAFRDFAKTYLRDHAHVNKRSAERDEYTVKVLNRTFGPLILHEITPHRIEQWKRERSGSRWKAHGQQGVSPSGPPRSIASSTRCGQSCRGGRVGRHP